MGLGGLVLEFPSLLNKGLRILMFQLSGAYCSLAADYCLCCHDYSYNYYYYYGQKPQTTPPQAA